MYLAMSSNSKGNTTSRKRKQSKAKENTTRKRQRATTTTNNASASAPDDSDGSSQDATDTVDATTDAGEDDISLKKLSLDPASSKREARIAAFNRKYQPKTRSREAVRGMYHLL